jgi:hypothetical protein
VGFLIKKADPLWGPTLRHIIIKISGRSIVRLRIDEGHRVLLVPLNLEVTTAEGSGGAKRALTGSNKSGGIRTFPSVGANGHEFPLTLNPEAAAAEAQEAQREREREGLGGA